MIQEWPSWSLRESDADSLYCSQATRPAARRRASLYINATYRNDVVSLVRHLHCNLILHDKSPSGDLVCSDRHSESWHLVLYRRYLSYVALPQQQVARAGDVGGNIA